MMFHFPTKGTPIKLYTAARDEKYIESGRMHKRRNHQIKVKTLFSTILTMLSEKLLPAVLVD